jgi:hypothetical protein
MKLSKKIEKTERMAEQYIKQRRKEYTRQHKKFKRQMWMLNIVGGAFILIILYWIWIGYK